MGHDKQTESALANDPAVGCSALVRRFQRRPGPGWMAYDLVPVWEHETGVRVHAIGLCLLGNRVTWISGDRWPEDQQLNRAIREQGGNRKRGLMVWALAVSSNDQAHLPPGSGGGAQKGESNVP